MYRLKKVMEEVESLREQLQILIGEKETFIDAEVLSVSKMIDVLLNEYYSLLKRKDDNNK